jgi:hypothetical protein
MQRALQEVLNNMDQARYTSQVERMRKIRAARLPAALAQDFRAMLHGRFPELTGESPFPVPSA